MEDCLCVKGEFECSYCGEKYVKNVPRKGCIKHKADFYPSCPKCTTLPKDYIEKLTKMCAFQLEQTDDTEQDHYNADYVLCSLLVELGFSDLVDKYNQIDKWYA